MPPEWPPTQWTLIRRCGALPPEQRRAELARLIELYRAPIEAAFRDALRRRGLPLKRAAQWAEDLAAQFVADKWVLGDMLSRIDRDGPARFKTFLYKCVSDAAVDALRKARVEAAAKDRTARPGDPFADAGRRFERNLALADLRHALLEARDWCEGKGWGATFRRFCRAFLEGVAAPAAGDEPLPERTWRDRCARIRARLHDAYRRRVAAGCLDPDEVERELEHVERLLLELKGIRWAELEGEGGLAVFEHG